MSKLLVRKKIGKFFLMVVLVVLLLGTILQAVFRHFEIKKINELAYGQTVNVDGRKMKVEVVGNGTKTIVILPALGVPSPILEFRQLAGLLSEHFTVITIEPFGYGLSDGTDKERSIENISEELHTCLEILGYTEYYLLSHSIYGAYSIYYSNQYPNEVKGIIGLDSSVPGMYSDIPAVINFLEDIFPYVGKVKTTVGISRFTSLFNPDFGIPAVDGYEWTSEEKKLSKWITLDKAYNKTVMDEVKRSKDNLNQMEELKFSENTPVLYFLSENNLEMFSTWKKIHEDLIQEKERSKIVPLSGNHYVYYKHGAEIAKTVTDWILND